MSRPVCLFGIALAALPLLAQPSPSSREGVRPNAFRATPDIPNDAAARAAESKSKLSPEERGDIAMARKNYREAIVAYREGRDTDPVLVNKIGIAYHQLLDFRSAQRQYEQAVKLKPDYAEAINNLGTVYYFRKSYRRAAGTYKKALRFAPRSASILSNLGTAYFARKNYKLAAECYQQALQIDPEVFERRSNQGTLLQDRSVEDRAKFHFYLAKTYAHAGQAERALQYLRKALEEGYKERNKLNEEPEFAALREMPEFKELLLLQPRVL